MQPRLGWPWALILASGLYVAQVRAGPAVPEYQVKAIFIYKFATYIRWPATRTDAITPFVIGIVGRDPFRSTLDAVVHGQTVHGKTIAVRRLVRLDDALRCDVLFVSSSERQRLRQIFETLKGAPVLTISDMDQFAELGGMIQLITIEDNRIRFDINKGAVDRAGLKAASQLLRLARIVESRSGGGAQ